MKSPRGTSIQRIIQSNDGLSIGRNNASHGTKNKLRLSSGGRTRANGGNSGGLSKRDTRREGRRIMDAIGGLYFLFHVSRVRSEGPLLRLHVLTAALMLTFSVIVSAKQSVGNPIDCVHTRDIPVEAFNAYCWIHSTYIVTGAMLGVAGVNVAFPGVAPSFSFYHKQKSDQEDHDGRHRASANDNPLIKHVKYYQWVAFCLIFQVQRASEDTFIFRLHYRVTVAFLLGGCLTLACKSISGSPIHCEGSGSVDKAVLETFCWLHTTYSLIHAFNMTVGQAVPYPGVTNSKNDLHGHGYHPLVKQHKYYQWVIFALLLQAILFYTPRWLWKGWEGGKIHALMMDLDIGLCSEVEKKQKKKMLLDYLWENLSFHNWWAYKYYICELLALINVVGQMFLMNRFFDGAFLTFGIDVLRFLESDQEDRVDPMIYVFPRMTKCTFYKYGVSGEVETHDAVCILPLNVVNEKIYVFLWFWFLALGVLSLLTVLYRVVIIFSPRTRVYLLRLRFHLVRRDAVETIVRRSKVGDWFLLYMLGENLDTVIYRDVMHELANKLATRHHHSLTGAKGELQEA